MLSAGTALNAAKDLKHALKHPTPSALTLQLSTRHLNALKQLAKIFKTAAKQETMAEVAKNTTKDSEAPKVETQETPPV